MFLEKSEDMMYAQQEHTRLHWSHLTRIIIGIVRIQMVFGRIKEV